MFSIRFVFEDGAVNIKHRNGRGTKAKAHVVKLMETLRFHAPPFLHIIVLCVDTPAMLLFGQFYIPAHDNLQHRLQTMEIQTMKEDVLPVQEH